MKVKESVGPPPGTYEGKFDGFMLTRGSRPKYVHQSQSGPQIRYTVKTSDGIAVPGSFPLDFNHYRLRNVLGAFGVPAVAVEPTFKKMGTQQFFSRLEKKLKQQNKTVSVWVRDSGGWISTIKPADDTYMVKFERIMTRDKSTDEPIHKTAKNSFGEMEDSFWVILMVVAGDHQGATFIYKLHYAIKSLGRSYELDKSDKRGKEFNSFFSYHGIDLSTFEPSTDFIDPDNGLPELEPLLLKSKTLMTIKVEDGWIKDVSKAASVTKSMINLEDGGGARKRKRRRSAKRTSRTEPVVTKSFDEDSELESARSIVRRVFVAEMNVVDLFDISTGELSPARKSKFIKFVKRHALPKKLIKKYTLSDVVDTLNILGYNDLAKKFETKEEKPKSRRRKVLRRNKRK